MDNEQTQPQPSVVDQSAEMTSQQEQNEPTVETKKDADTEMQDVLQELKKLAELHKQLESRVEKLQQTSASLGTSMPPELDSVALTPLPTDEKVWFTLEKKEDLPEMQRVSKREEQRIRDRIDKGFAYDMHLDEGGTRGRAIVFHNDKVTGEHDRKGNEHDVAALKHVFQNGKLNFEFVEYSNLTADKLREVLKTEANREELKDIAVLFIFFMSHGSKDCIWAADKGFVHFPEILGAFDSNNCTHMDGKPKAVFIQACQEKPVGQSDGGSSAPVQMPQREVEEEARMHMKHFVRFVGAYADARASRIYDHGSFYIQALCYVISCYAHQFHLTEILTQTSALVNNHAYNFCHLPVMESTLDKDVFLCPGI